MSSQVGSQIWSAERCAALLQKPRRVARGFKACCPAHDDSEPSLFLADGDQGGMVLICYAGCEYRSIAQALEARGAVLPNTYRDDVERVPHEHFQLGAYHAYWDYRDAGGVVIQRICRWNQPDGKKDIRPLVKTVDGWKWQHHGTPRPLFQLDRLANEPEKHVIIVEGEKAALAAQKLFPDFVATTWPGGAKSVGQTDWTPLKGRDVVLVPDCDAPGRSAMAWVSNALKTLARSIRVVDPLRLVDDLPEGWDLADALTEGRNVSEWLKPEAAAPPRLIELGFTAHEARVHLEVPYLVKDLFDRGQMIVLWGKPGSGKTFLACHLSCHIGAGAIWVGKRVKKGRVIYLCAESTRIRLENRISMLITRYPELAQTEVIFVPISVDLRLNEADIQDVIVAARSMQDAALIVVDTLATTMGGGDENGSDDMGTYISNVKRIKAETGAAVLIVHHGGKDEARGMRGHSSLEAAIDAELIVERVEAAPGQPTRILKSGKLREGLSNTDLFAFDLEACSLGIDSDGDVVSTCVVVPSSTSGGAVRRPPSGTQGRLLKALEESFRKGQCVWSMKDIRSIAANFMHRNSVTKSVMTLCDAGFVRQSVGGFVLSYPPEKDD